MDPTVIVAALGFIATLGAARLSATAARRQDLSGARRELFDEAAGAIDSLYLDLEQAQAYIAQGYFSDGSVPNEATAMLSRALENVRSATHNAWRMRVLGGPRLAARYDLALDGLGLMATNDMSPEDTTRRFDDLIDAMSDALGTSSVRDRWRRRLRDWRDDARTWRAARRET